MPRYINTLNTKVLKQDKNESNLTLPFCFLGGHDIGNAKLKSTLLIVPVSNLISTAKMLELNLIFSIMLLLSLSDKAIQSHEIRYEENGKLKSWNDFLYSKGLILFHNELIIFVLFFFVKLYFKGGTYYKAK